ncbi:hypothetical protein CXG81DRAFT_28541 [Caulochytrium protostelioides]|uniref:Uncharacterized protein n=1 Tax=Caulochytrium protostelioides TaxID=1555241 RepID=A0A4P9X2L1_9FUNG|nr:hypothetical protein CXG81DRAFT_28541 [Caulochytrium protostelioides]|eukprot:RKO98656.1 hypothetical protein CXG81DRAFT_28541 [Caulochytrium protostelioides]
MLGTLITASLVSLALQVPLAAAGPLSLVKRDDAADKAWDNAVEDKALWATHQDAEIKLLNRLPTAIRKDLKIINVHDALSFEPTIYEIEGKDHFFEASLNVWMDELKLFDAKTAEIKDGDKTIKVEPFLDEFKKIISSQKPSYNQCLPSPEALKSHRTALKQILGYYFSYWQQMEPPPKTGIDTNNHGRRMTWNRLNLGCMFPAIRGVIEHIREKRGGRGLPLPGLANMVPFRMHVTEYYRHNGKKFQTSGSGPVPETMLDVISLPCPANHTGSSVPVLDMTDEKKSSIIVMYGNKLKGKGVDILFETEPISAYRFEVCRPNK